MSDKCRKYDYLNCLKPSEIFNDMSKFIQDHPKGTALTFIVGSCTLGLCTCYQCVERKREKNRHYKVENLQKEAIRRQEVSINSLRKEMENVEYVNKLNKILVDYIESDKGGGENV